MSIVITVPGLGGDKNDSMSEWLDNFVDAPGRVQQKLEYPASPGTQSIAVGALKLDSAIRHYLDQGATVTVLAHSQGAEVVSVWLEREGDDDTIPTEWLKFILTGNPRRRLGGAGKIGWDGKPIGRTPETRFSVRDIARRWDGWCNNDNFPGSPRRHWLRLLWGRFTDHRNYRKVTLPGCQLREFSGNTQYLIHS